VTSLFVQSKIQNTGLHWASDKQDAELLKCTLSCENLVCVIIYNTFTKITGWPKTVDLLLRVKKVPLYIRRSNVPVICGHNMTSILWSNTAYCVKLSGEDLSRYSTKIESVGLRKCPYYRIIAIVLRLWFHSITNISQSWPHMMVGKQLGQIDEEITSLSP